MHLIDKKQAYCFGDFANVLLRDIQNKKFPKDIKHVVFGHGLGTSIIKEEKDSWHAAFKPEVKNWLHNIYGRLQYVLSSS